MKENLEDLRLTSSHWGTYRAGVSNGREQKLLPFEHDLYLDPSLIGPGIIDVQDGPIVLMRQWCAKAGSMVAAYTRPTIRRPKQKLRREFSHEQSPGSL